MALKKNYSRYFIILQEDQKEYSLSSEKVASGYAKLEMKNDKCKISYYVQNLKKEMAPYYMVLICNKKEVKKIIKIGEMNIDDYGRADICYEYPVDNVAGSNIPMDKISGAAIVKILNNNILSVMSGFASTEIPEWKSFVVIENKTRNKDEEEKNIEGKNIEEKSIFDKYEESIEILKKDRNNENKNIESAAQEDVLEVKDQNEENDLKVEKQRQECSEVDLEKNLKEDEEDIGSYEEQINEASRENDNEEAKHNYTPKYEEIDHQFINNADNKEDEDDLSEYSRETTGDFFKSIVQGFEKVPEVCSNIKRCKWYKVPVKRVEDMYDVSDYNRYTIIYYPMISYYPYIANYGHYLIGYKYDKKGKTKYLVYGIPGIKDKMYQPFGGKSGFVTWIPAQENDKSVDGLGYWLMFYDFKTSTIVIPVKK